MTSARFVAKVSWRAGNRVTRAYVKLQYGAVFGLTETLARAWAIGLIRWFRIDTIKAGELTPEMRAALVRWPEAVKSIREEISA